MWGYCLLRGPEVPAGEAPELPLDAGEPRARSRERREQVDSVRRRSDREVLRGLRWGYPLDQFLTLGRERGESEGPLRHKSRP